VRGQHPEAPLGGVQPASALSAASRSRSGITIAYVMSRFPKLSETFVLNEIVAVEAVGANVAVYPLLRERTDMVQPAARPLVERARYQRILSVEVLTSMLRTLVRHPYAYLTAIGTVLRGTWGSFNFFFGAIGIIPKVTRMAEMMQDEGVTHVHCHFASHPAVAGFLIQRLTGIPFSFTAHGSDLHVDRHMLPQKVAEAAFVIAISDSNKRIIEADCGHSGNVQVLHCGVDLDAFAPSLPVAAAAEPESFNVVCIGTLHEVKGQIHLLEALSLLKAEGLSLPCVLVGEGRDRAKLQRRIIAEDLDVRLAGRMTSPEVAALLRRAAVAVTPSVPTRGGKREGLPVVLMEAMAAGVAVVASDLSGIPELVLDDRTGLLVPPGDARAIADALRRLHDDPTLRYRLGQAARAKVDAEFNLRANARTLVDLVAGVPSPL